MLRSTSFGQGKKSPGTASMMLPGGSKEEEIFIFGLQKRFVMEGGFFPNNMNELSPSIVDQPIFAELFQWAQDAEAIPGLFYWQPAEWDAFMRNCQMLYSDMISVDDFAKDMQRAHDQ